MRRGETVHSVILIVDDYFRSDFSSRVLVPEFAFCHPNAPVLIFVEKGKGKRKVM
jgi:hypothetical protein